MNVLFGVVLMGNSKDYVVPKFEEMHAMCVAPYADTLVVGDRPLDGMAFASCTTRKVRPYWSEDVLWTGQLVMRKAALEGPYDGLVLAGIDMLYANATDFRDLLDSAHGRDITGALQVARSDSKYAVCRRFVHDTDGEQIDVLKDELDTEWVIPTGYPGSDAIVLSRRVLEMPWWDEDPEMMTWYERVDAGRPNMCLAECLVWRAQMNGMGAWCDTNVRPWHCHEDGIARRWYGQERPIASLRW